MLLEFLTKLFLMEKYSNNIIRFICIFKENYLKI